MAPRRTPPRPPAPIAEKPGSISKQEDLREEIASLRQFIRQVSQSAGDTSSLQEMLRVLETISRASSRLANLLRAQRQLHGQPQQREGVLSDSLKEILADMTKNL